MRNNAKCDRWMESALDCQEASCASVAETHCTATLCPCWEGGAPTTDVTGLSARHHCDDHLSWLPAAVLKINLPQPLLSFHPLHPPLLLHL